MQIYHGTSQLALERILKGGLEPPRTTGESSTRFDARNPEVVYLTTNHAPYYAFRRCMFDGCARAAIIEYDLSQLDASKIVFDDQVLEEVGRQDDKLPDHWNQKERLIYYQSLVNKGAIDHIPWTTSLAIMGSIGYRGKIAADVIKRFAVIDLHILVPETFGVVDPEISTFTHKVRKLVNSQMTKKIFEKKEEIEGVEVHER